MYYDTQYVCACLRAEIGVFKDKIAALKNSASQSTMHWERDGYRSAPIDTRKFALANFEQQIRTREKLLADLS